MASGIVTGRSRRRSTRSTAAKRSGQVAAPLRRSVSSWQSARSTSARCTTCEATSRPLTLEQRAGRRRLQEHVQTVQVSTHAHESRCLLQTGDEGAERAGRLRARHARNLYGPRQVDDQIDIPGGQAGMQRRRNVAHARAGVVRDERTQRRRWRCDRVVRVRHRHIVADAALR